MLPNLGGMNPQKMLQKMQQDTLRLQEELDAERLETSAGGGMVRVVTTGMGEVLEIKIAPEVVDPNDIEMLQDLIVTAVRDALKKAQDHHSEKMSGIMGGLKIPGLGL
ncbi:MAG: nucleoid-associated protein EbfC [Abditibacteriota bacterium]|nr:nucleoid-associated protein EbfC [Abditibacteriota bacterium]